MPRLFVAIDIPSEIASRLTLVQSGLPGARWVEREDFHLTLRFVGDIDHNLANEFSERLELVTTQPFYLEIAELKVFGNSKPHSVYASIKPCKELYKMQRSIERICQNMAFPNAAIKKFTPHITIAKVRGILPTDIARYLSNCGLVNAAPFRVEKFGLYLARNSVGGGPYVCEETYRLVEKDAFNDQTIEDDTV